MLEKIKNFLNEFKITIVAAIIALAYICGKKKGKDNEKASQTKTVLANISRADNARRRLRDPVVVRRLHDKYKRK